MKILIQFLRDQLGYLCTYCLCSGLIISYYVLTVDRAEVVFPACLSAFLLFAFLLIRSVFYVSHREKLMRLSENPEKMLSSIKEYEAAYHTIEKVHRKYQLALSEHDKKDTEEKRLISAFVHNLKTPVTVSSLILQRMEEKKMSEQEILTSVQNLTIQNIRMNQTLTMLLDLQRLTEFANDYQPQELSLSEELHSVINENKALFIHSKVYPKLTDTDAVILTDKKWNTILLNQLISNAVKYSKGTEPKSLYFSAEKDGDSCKLYLQDEGIGIPEYDLPKVFDAFFTGEHGREGFSSSGIGLYLCKKICDKCGMTITVENHNGCLVTIKYLSKL